MFRIPTRLTENISYPYTFHSAYTPGIKNEPSVSTVAPFFGNYLAAALIRWRGLPQNVLEKKEMILKKTATYLDPHLGASANTYLVKKKNVNYPFIALLQAWSITSFSVSRSC